MILGHVEDLEARASITLRIADGRDVTIEFVVDTGFAGALTLPPAAVAALGLPLAGEIIANLADNTPVPTRAHRATLLWAGDEREVAVLALGQRPLLGTSLLEDCRLTVDFFEGGLVRIDPIP